MGRVVSAGNLNECIEQKIFRTESIIDWIKEDGSDNLSGTIEANCMRLKQEGVGLVNIVLEES